MRKVLKTKAWVWHSLVAYLVTGKIIKQYRVQVWVSRKWIKFFDEKQYYACQEKQLWVATVYLRTFGD